MKRLLFFILFCSSWLSATKTISSSVAFTDPQGNVLANGSINFQLCCSAKLITNGQVVQGINITVTLTAGGLIPGSTVIIANDEMQPTGTYYIVNIFNSNGAPVRGPENWILAGASPIDLSTITNSLLPDPGLGNPVLQNPSAAQTISGFPLTLTNLGTFNAGITGTGNIGTLNLGSTVLGANNAFTGANTFNNLNAAVFVNATQSFATALAACPNPGTIIVTSGTYTVSTNASIPATCTLQVQGGGILSVSGGVTLTINGAIFAPAIQIFSGTGTIVISAPGLPTYANWFPGADCGAKITAADGAMGSLSGEIWVGQSCGTSAWSAISLSQAHTLHFVESGTFIINTITLAPFAALISDFPVASPRTSFGCTGGGNGVVNLCQAAGTNANPLITMGQQSAIRDIMIEGNKANNATGGPCVEVIGNTALIQNLGVFNCPSHSVQVGTIGNNVAEGTTIYFLWAIASAGSALFCENMSDLTIVHGEFENSSRYGIEGTNCAVLRLSGGSDFGNNALGGIHAVCVNANPNPSTGGWLITGNNFGKGIGSGGPDLYVKQYDPVGNVLCGNGWTIAGNVFGGFASGNNVSDAIQIADSGGGNSIIGNTINSTSGAAYKNGVEWSESAGGRAQVDTFFGNSVYGSVGTGDFAINVVNSPILGGNQSFGSSSSFIAPERSTCPGGGSGRDIMCAESTAHRWQMSNNSGSLTPIVGQATSDALTNKTLNTPLTSGTGLEIFNTTTTCTTAASVGATCTTAAISLPVAQADTSYRINCTGKGLTNVPVVIGTTNSSATQFTITIAALTAAAATFSSYDCIAGHN